MAAQRPSYKSRNSDSYQLSYDFSAIPKADVGVGIPILPHSPGYGPNSQAQALTPVALAPWVHNRAALVGLCASLVLQAGLFAAALYLTRNPELLPTGRNIFSSVSLKNFNILVSVIGAVIGGASVYGVSIGARSYLSHKLVTGGVSLETFDQLFAMGNGGLVRKFGVGGILPLILFALASFASSAVVALFTAAVEHQVLELALKYPTIAENPAFYSNATVLADATLLAPQDFDGFAWQAARWIRGGQETLNTTLIIDGTQSQPATGLPSMLAVVTLTSNIYMYNGTDIKATPPTLRQRNIVNNATDNTYIFAAPVATTTSTCITGTMSSTVTGYSGNFVLLNVTDSTCGEQSLVLENVDANLASAYGCMSGNSSYLAYFTYNPVLQNFTPRAQCTSTTLSGDGEGIKYVDADGTVRYTPNFAVSNEVAASTVALNVLSLNWIRDFGARGSPGLSFYIASLDEYAHTPQTVNGQSQPMDVLREYSQLSVAMLNMALAKIINTETYFMLYNGQMTDGTVGQTRQFYTQATSTAYEIGPRGANKAWLGLIGLMFFALLVATIFTVRYPPVTFNPLSPVSVLLVAQNSPVTALADGGCLGDVEQVRAPDQLIRYRAVNDQHLAFTWGPTSFEPPHIGRIVTLALSKAGFIVRALTRSPDSPKTTSLFPSNSKSIIPTYFDLAELPSIEKAFDGAEVVYGMTVAGAYMFAPPGSDGAKVPEYGEREQGKRMVDVAKEKGVKIFAWSTVPDGLKEYKLENFDCKNAVNEYIKKVGLPALFIDLGSFNENMLRYGGSLKKNDNGKLCWFAPHVNPAAAKSIPSVSLSHDLGPAVALAVEHFDTDNLNHTHIRVCCEIMSLQDKVAIAEKILGHPIPLISLPSVGPPGCVADRMTKAFSEKSYFDPSTVPDKFLTSKGFKFDTFEEFFKREVVPTLQA